MEIIVIVFTKTKFQKIIFKNLAKAAGIKIQMSTGKSYKRNQKSPERTAGEKAVELADSVYKKNESKMLFEIENVWSKCWILEKSDRKARNWICFRQSWQNGAGKKLWKQKYQLQ